MKDRPKVDDLGDLHMEAFADPTVQDVITLVGSDYLIDGLWEEDFGQSIQYRYRSIPKQLIYLLHKYGPVIPHRTFWESIAEICAEEELDPNTRKIIKKNLTQEKAEKLIEVALALRLITRLRPRQDRRYWLYTITTEQMEKLHRIEKGAAEVYQLIKLQAANPADHKVGLNEQNKRWYRHIVPDLVMRQDETFHREKARLSKLKYLLSVIALFGIITAATTVAVSYATIGAAKATISDGTK
jgi:hypothetical protein